mgnify:CR=1 FL=1
MTTVAQSILSLLRGANDLSGSELEQTVSSVFSQLQNPVKISAPAGNESVHSALCVVVLEHAKVNASSSQLSNSLDDVGLNPEIVKAITTCYGKNNTRAVIRENLLGTGGPSVQSDDCGDDYELLSKLSFLNAPASSTSSQQPFNKSEDYLVGVDYRIDYRVRSCATMGERSVFIISFVLKNGNGDERTEIVECKLSQVKDLLFKVNEALEFSKKMGAV